jgi:hypothetical protein
MHGALRNYPSIPLYDRALARNDALVHIVRLTAMRYPTPDP